jgi:Raf kinase inhibitor-like YbhB/YbcL family protein
MIIQLTSTAFAEGQTIPEKYTADGADLSPPLAWHGAPENTESFALICDDPDAPSGTWVHWVIYNLPVDQHHLPEGVPSHEGTLQHGAHQGKNSFGRLGYGGPSPPPGKPHRYIFKIHALSTKLNLSSGASRNALESAMKGHILAEGRLTGKYGR